MVGRILQCVACTCVVRAETQITRQEQQERFGAMVGLGLRLLAMVTIGTHPRQQVGQQRTKSIEDRLFAGDQIVPEPGECVVGLVLTALIAVWTVHEAALLEPASQIGTERSNGGVCLLQIRHVGVRHEKTRWWQAGVIRQ